MKCDKSVRWENVTYNLVLTTKETELFQVILTDDGVGPADVAIYDGTDANGRAVSLLRSLQHATLQVNFEEGITLNQGLFVKVGENVGSCLVRYREC